MRTIRTVTAPMTVLILAGSSEATLLATELDGAGFDVISSFAGSTSSPRLRPGRTRSGGFGGADGLFGFLTVEHIDIVIDTTHPFAAQMPFHAAQACERAAIPLCRLTREGWHRTVGDRWVDVDDLADAARALQRLDARRVMLTTGRRVDAFDQCAGQWFLARSIEPLDVERANLVSLLDRGPFTVESERDVMVANRIDTVVTKNAGGSATAAKLVAARELDLTVVMVRRPPQPEGVTTASTVSAAIEWASSIQPSR